MSRALALVALAISLGSMASCGDSDPKADINNETYFAGLRSSVAKYHGWVSLSASQFDGIDDAPVQAREDIAEHALAYATSPYERTAAALSELDPPVESAGDHNRMLESTSAMFEFFKQAQSEIKPAELTDSAAVAALIGHRNFASSVRKFLSACLSLERSGAEIDPKYDLKCEANE